MQEVYEAFAGIGIPTIQASRIRKYRDTVSSLMTAEEAGQSITQDVAEVLIQTQVELFQLRTILGAASASGPSGAWLERVRALASGSPMPRATPKNRDARDEQFHSFLAAVADLSGYPTRFDEPDVVLALPSAEFGVAAKRPRSTQSVPANVRSAAKQIRDTRLPGLIALDLSHALLPRKCLQAATLHEAGQYLKELTDAYLLSRVRDIKARCHDAEVLGVLGCTTVPAMIHVKGVQIATTTRWTLLLLSEFDDPRTGDLLQFVNACERGLFGPRQSSE